MEPGQILAKYEEAVGEFEALLSVSSNGTMAEIVQKYQDCISRIGSLMTIETDQQLQPILGTISCHTTLMCQKMYDTNLAQLPDTCKTGQSKYPDSTRKDTLKRREAIQATLRPTYGHGLTDVIGLENVKSELRKSIILPLQFPSLFTGGRKPSCHILLYGPPGNGKSKIASAIAEEAKVSLYCISSADLLSSWVGESEKMIKELFDYTKTSNQKCIVFIDEIDSICRRRDDREADHSRRLKNQLLIELDSNLNNPKSNCIVLCATNCPWDIDVAFLRRFQGRIHVPLPDRESRLLLLKAKSKGVSINMSPEDWKTIVDRTEGYSGSDLTNVVGYAIQEPISELDKSHFWILSKDSKWLPCTSETLGCLKGPLSSIPPDKVSIRSVRLKDFAKALLVIPKTVSSSDVEKYKMFIC
ncbi:vacuolar protein sorting-associated protein 4-like isoform X2 [Cimex lectularius]|uniref:AAA+ ATPase domain-containing protein n=1 Tax=Cimex lectularius TaxID=79782 RepID=A0A8I6SR13_CIMLE|nr:vacuolar protein sorting-associated protein 4-like isoform X2 [Cimex lectularius]